MRTSMNRLDLGQGFVILPLSSDETAKENAYFLGWGAESVDPGCVGQFSTVVDFFNFDSSKPQSTLGFSNSKIFPSFKELKKTFLKEFYSLKSGRIWNRELILANKNLLAPGARFQKKFEQIKNSIQAGLVNKVVLLDSWVDSYSQAQESKELFWNSLIEFFENKSDSVGGEDLFFAYANSTRGVFGLSPEYIFVARQESSKSMTKIKTMALAGTQKRDSRSEALFLNDPKERYEHQLVAQEIFAKWSSPELGAKLLGEPATLVAHFGQISHLKTLFDFQVDAPMELDLVRKWVSVLHPTPALGVSPKTDFTLGIQKKLNSDLESRIFGAPLLVHSKESNQIRSVALVQIRCVEFVFSTGQNQGAFVLTTGCGVVGASRLEQEQKEIQLKRLATLSRLGLV